jgi:hypothetical protein
MTRPRVHAGPPKVCRPVDEVRQRLAQQVAAGMEIEHDDDPKAENAWRAVTLTILENDFLGSIATEFENSILSVEEDDRFTAQLNYLQRLQVRLPYMRVIPTVEAVEQDEEVRHPRGTPARSRRRPQSDG